MLIFISIFIPASLRGSVEIWTRNEIEGNRSPVENNRRTWCEQAAENRESHLSFENRERKEEREFVYLFFFQSWKMKNQQGTKFSNRSQNTSLRCVIILTFLLKCEVFREMTALVIASEEEQCGWMAQLKCPQVQYALEQTTEKRNVILNCKTYLLAQKKKGINFYIHHSWTKLREIRLVSWMKRPRDELLEIFPCRLLIFLTRVERDYYNNRASLRHINGIMLRIIQYDTFAKRTEPCFNIFNRILSLILLPAKIMKNCVS